MTSGTEEFLNKILEGLDRIDFINLEEIPDIELYMDQVTTFMSNRLPSAPE